MEKTEYEESYKLDWELFEILGIEVQDFKQYSGEELTKKITQTKAPGNRTIENLMKERRIIINWLGLIYRDRFVNVA